MSDTEMLTESSVSVPIWCSSLCMRPMLSKLANETLECWWLLTFCSRRRQHHVFPVVLSPRLFSLYIYYMSTLLHDLKVGCYIDSTCMNHYFYADDMCLLSPSPIGLQQLIDVCTKYGIEHDIIFNPIKTKCVAFLPNRYKLFVPTVSLDGDDLVYTDNIKYLGVILSNNLKDDSDIMRQLRCLYASSNILLRKFAHCSLEVKLKVVQSFCLNFYCSSLWCVYTKQSLTKIRVAYNNIFRKLLGYRKWDSASTMFVNHRIDGFDASVRKSCFKFRQRALLCDNNIISTTNRSTWVTSNYIWHRWTLLVLLICKQTTNYAWALFITDGTLRRCNTITKVRHYEHVHEHL